MTKALTGAGIRESFLRFFEERGHARVPSDSLVPANDPTLLFTGAGMNQFKDMFLGKGTLPYRRVTTAQKCLRVPDLDNVGKTPRHHTFFEMLGNFSFGDYFKKECIAWEWEFFTRVVGLPGERLLATVYLDDDEAYEIWRRDIGLPASRIYRFGEKENFWPAEAPSKGPNGPCGPCSEIYFDAAPDRPWPSAEGLQSLPEDRFTEVGNCVFTQFDRRADGKLVPLPQKNIDVGLGLERIAAVVQGAKNNFETDLFRPYLEWLGKRAGRAYGGSSREDERMRRVADHVRAVTFCIADGVVPGNEGRGYVVRKILRRAIRDGYELGIEKPFLHEMVAVVGQVMGEAYPEVVANAGQVRALVRSEEEGFRSVYAAGMERVQTFFETLPAGDTARRHPAELRKVPGSGRFAFELHDTFGFPVDITRQVFADRGMSIDEAEFEAAMEEQRTRGREASAMTKASIFDSGPTLVLKERRVPPTAFNGYSADDTNALVLALIRGDEVVDALTAGEEGFLVPDQTVFYAEAGGQVGDRGALGSSGVSGEVIDCQMVDGYRLHRVRVKEGTLRVKDPVMLVVDAVARRATERNHTATHLLHRALKDVLGAQVSQAGSLVAPDRLRFDFTHGERLTGEQIRRIEDAVNREVMKATPVAAVERTMEEARGDGFIALFGEKYGDRVRTLAVGEYSKELCGGTHVKNSGNIGPFRITSEGSIASGVRRIEAVTGEAAVKAMQADREVLESLAARLKVSRTEIPQRVEAMLEEIRAKKREKDRSETARTAGSLERVLASAVTSGSSRLLVDAVEGLDAKELLEVCDRMRSQGGSFACFLVSVVQDKIAIVAAASKDRVEAGFHAGNTVKEAAALLGGGGGGRPDMAQGQGRDRGRVEEALALARKRLSLSAS